MKDICDGLKFIGDASRHECHEQCADTKKDLTNIIIVDITKTLNVDDLVQLHPVFTKHNFNLEDIDFLKKNKKALIDNKQSDRFLFLRDMIAELPEERVDLAEAIMFIFGRVESLDSAG